jgi:hypothetical protein
VLRGLARRLGYHLVPATPYSPVPEGLADDVFERASPMPGVDFDVDAQLRFLERELAPFLSELLSTPTANPFYGPGDAEVAYAMMRWLRPRRVVEIGSGYSTRFLQEALERNGDGAAHVVVDPFAGGLPPGVELRRTSAADVDEDLLKGADLLFIDSTHVLKAGGEVNRLLLETLPALVPGVIVHVHDVFLPYEYPRAIHEQGAYWQEQYALHALLVCSDAFEVLAGLHALYRQRRERFAQLVNLGDRPALPSAIWLRRT